MTAPATATAASSARSPTSWLDYQHPHHKAMAARWQFALDHYTGDILLPERIHLYLLRRQFGEPLESYLERCRIADYVKHYGSGRSGSCLSRRRRTQRRSRPCRSWAATDQWAVKAV